MEGGAVQAAAAAAENHQHNLPSAFKPALSTDIFSMEAADQEEEEM